MTITFNIFRSLLEWLGLLESEIQRIDRMIKEYSQKLDIQRDHLKDTKYDIEDIQDLIKHKERDYKSSQQSSHYIQTVKEEISLLFKKMEYKSSQRDLIVRNINAITLVISKYKQLKLAIETKLDTEALEDLRETLSDYIQDLDKQDRELKRLERVGYKSQDNVASDNQQSVDQLINKEKESNVQPSETQTNPEIVDKPVTTDSAASSESDSDKQSVNQEKESNVQPPETQTNPKIVDKPHVSSASSESDSVLLE